jgi:hypothetical protein
MHQSGFTEMAELLRSDVPGSMKNKALWLGEPWRWLHFFLSGVSVQSLDAVQRMGRLQDLRSTYQSRLQSLRAAGRLL